MGRDGNQVESIKCNCSTRVSRGSFRQGTQLARVRESNPQCGRPPFSDMDQLYAPVEKWATVRRGSRNDAGPPGDQPSIDARRAQDPSDRKTCIAKVSNYAEGLGTISSLRSLGGCALLKFSRQRTSNWALLKAGNARFDRSDSCPYERSAALFLMEKEPAHTVTLSPGGQSSAILGRKGQLSGHRPIAVITGREPVCSINCRPYFRTADHSGLIESRGLKRLCDVYSVVAAMFYSEYKWKLFT